MYCFYGFLLNKNMLDAYKKNFKNLEQKIGKIFSYLHLKPNFYTLLSIPFALITFYFLVNERIIIAVLFFLITSFLDWIDGALARYENLATKFGAYLDTVVDRIVEGILLLGILFLPLPKILMPSYFWVFLILFGSLMTTYVKAAAKEKDLVVEELKGGLLSRSERLTLIIISLLFGYFINFYWTVYLLIIIALLTNLTVFQRVYVALKKQKK